MVMEGRRPPRPEHRHLSDGIWGMIEGCWSSDLLQRMTITKVIAVLEAELDHQ